MSDYVELLLRADSLPLYNSGGEASDLPDELAAALRATEAERRHHEIQASSLRTDLEYMTRRATAAEARLAEYERFRGDAEKVARAFDTEMESNAQNFMAMSFQERKAHIIATLTTALTSAFASGAESAKPKHGTDCPQCGARYFDLSAPPATGGEG